MLSPDGILRIKTVHTKMTKVCSVLFLHSLNKQLFINSSQHASYHGSSSGSQPSSSIRQKKQQATSGSF